MELRHVFYSVVNGVWFLFVLAILGSAFYPFVVDSLPIKLAIYYIIFAGGRPVMMIMSSNTDEVW